MKLIFAVLLVISPVVALAGASQGKVTKPLVSHLDVFIFSAGTLQQGASCAVSNLGTWAVDLTTDHGKAIQAVVLTAYAQGKEIEVRGRGVCDVFSDRESVDYLFIVD